MTPPDASQPPPVEREFVIRSELGLHARPAGRFVALAGRFECEIEVGRGQEWVNGRSVLSILSLAASQGTSLRLRAVGHDAEAAVDALGALLEAAEEPPAPHPRAVAGAVGSV